MRRLPIFVATALTALLVLLMTFGGEASAQVSDLSWATSAPMPTPRFYFGLAAANNGKIYAIGGRTAALQSLATVEEYDPATDTWVIR